MALRWIHITGGPGSGKTTLAERLSAALNAPTYDLDGMALELEAKGIRPPFEAIAAELPRILEGEAWVSEGVYMTWAKPLFDRADLVIWLDIPWRVASYRMIVRHLKAELTRNNRFPGWRRLYRFMRSSDRYYRDRDLPGFHPVYGTPYTRSSAGQWIEAYRDKLVVCRSKAEIERLLEQIGTGDALL